MANTTEDMIKQMYESQLASQKEQLTTDYSAADSRLTAQQQQNQKVTDENLNRTAVEAQKDAINRAEYYAAAGLTSGARAQARLAQDTQLQENLTAIRTARQAADAEIERKRSLLSQEYASAIRKAQSENDMQKAKALYELAAKEEQKLRANEEAAAGLMAKSGDFSRLAAIYGLTDAEIATLKGDYEAAKTAKALEELKTKYPDGIVGNELEWEQLKAQHGEDVLREAGLSFQQEVKDKIPDSVLSYITAKYPNKTVTSSEDWQILLNSYGAELLAENGITYQTPQGVTGAPASPVGIKTPAVDQIVSGMTDIDSKVPVHQFTVSQTSGNKSPNRLANGNFMISGREMTAAEVLKGVQNGTIIETYDPKTDSYTYTIRKTGSGSTNAKSQTAMLN